MGRPSQVVVLAEDHRHQLFVYWYLRRLGRTRHEIRNEDLPARRGCGEQWVRDRYANAVAAFRARTARAATEFIVAIDADNGDVNRRLRQLETALKQADLASRGPEERIVHLIPKWKIEAWIVCLSGDQIDEDYRDYSRVRDIDGRIATAAATLYEWSRPNTTPPPHCSPSLLAAISELRRLDK
jgi:hypothetical protein